MTARKEVPVNEIGDTEWETVAQPRTKVEFDTVGDELIGVWEGFREVQDPNPDRITGELPDPYVYCDFLENGEPVTCSASYTLKQGLENVPTGKMVRIKLVSTQPSKKGNDLKNFKIDVAR